MVARVGNEPVRSLYLKRNTCNLNESIVSTKIEANTTLKHQRDVIQFYRLVIKHTI